MITLFEGRELKGEADVPFELKFEGNGVVEDKNAAKKAEFLQNLRYWNEETSYMSVNNINNIHFEWIVEQGKEVVPYIYEELKKGKPTMLVYALNKMYPGVVKCNGYVSLKQMCDTWMKILSSKMAL